MFTTIPAPAADTVEEGGDLVLQVGKQCFDKLLLKREPFLQLRASRFWETLRYWSRQAPNCLISYFFSFNPFHLSSALQYPSQYSLRISFRYNRKKKKISNKNWVLLSKWTKYRLIQLPSRFLGETDSRYLENSTHASKESWTLREPDKGEFTEFNKTAFVFATCKIQRANPMCCVVAGLWTVSHSPVWSFPAFI